jgi:hypothetical protein
MMNGGAWLGDVELDVLYMIGYSEMYRLVELSMTEDHHKALAKVDAALRDATPDADTGLPPWVLSQMPVAADGTPYAQPG